MEISEIEIKYNSHSKKCEEIFNKLVECEIKYPVSNEILSDISLRISYIFNSLVTEAKNNNLYSCLILYRSLLEHFFKSFLIFEKMLSDKSDEVAESYKKHLMVSEFLAEKAGVLHMEEMINGNEMKTDFITFINAKIPELEGFDRENQQEISKAIKLFSLKESVKYLHSKFKDRESLKNSSHILAQFLPEYSYASTFTHGGSYGSTLIQKFIKDSTVKDEIERILEISLTSICVSKESIIGTYEVNINTKEYIKNLQEIRN